MNKAPKVAILLGSKSDLPQADAARELLGRFKVPHEVRVLSAHRAAERTARYVEETSAAGCQVYICAAGGAAHLAGAVAARTLRPVIGVPLASSALQGFDALLSTVQMPPGVPVGTMAVGEWGMQNAAIYAAQILALGDPELDRRLREHREAAAGPADERVPGTEP